MLDTVLIRLGRYARLTRLDKPVGITLLLWPTLWALWLAVGGVPDALNLVVFVAGVVLMRSAGCAINDYADRDFDPHVARTRERPLAAGLIQPWEALMVFACWHSLPSVWSCCSTRSCSSCPWSAYCWRRATRS